jgi:hypothetical protein
VSGNRWLLDGHLAALRDECEGEGDSNQRRHPTSVAPYPRGGQRRRWPKIRRGVGASVLRISQTGSPVYRKRSGVLLRGEAVARVEDGGGALGGFSSRSGKGEEERVGGSGAGAAWKEGNGRQAWAAPLSPNRGGQRGAGDSA